MLSRVFLEPLFVFAVAGIAQFAVHSVLQPRGGDPVRLSAATRAALIADFETLTGRSATAADIALIEREYVTDEPFAQGESFPRYGRSILRGMFGQPFVDALWAAPVGEWSGPIESSQGWHYVRITERLPETLLSFDVVRDQVENDHLVAVIRQAVERRVAELEQRHDVTIER